MRDGDRLEPPGHDPRPGRPLRRLASVLASGLTLGLAPGLASGAGPSIRERTVDGVRYRPIGGGQVEVVFPSGEVARIRPGEERAYHDLEADPRLDAARALAGLIKPGDRVLSLGTGTGAAAGLLAEAVGHTGAVVSLEHDGESVRFARRRYPSGHCAHEIGGWRHLAGELDGAFEAAIVCEPARAEGERIASPDMLDEVARLLPEDADWTRGIAVAAALGPARAESIAGLLARRVPRLGPGRPQTLGGGWGCVVLIPTGASPGEPTEPPS